MSWCFSCLHAPSVRHRTAAWGPSPSVPISTPPGRSCQWGCSFPWSYRPVCLPLPMEMSSQSPLLCAQSTAAALPDAPAGLLSAVVPRVAGGDVSLPGTWQRAPRPRALMVGGTQLEGAPQCFCGESLGVRQPFGGGSESFRVRGFLPSCSWPGM